jgi:DNA-binding transcriptional LysR family regulator
MLVAAPSYLERHGIPANISELEQHTAILYSNRSIDWRFAGQGGDAIVHPQRVLRVNNGLIMRDAAVAGIGITLLPTFMMHNELKSGALSRIDVGMEPEGAEIHLAYPNSHQASAKLRALIEHLRHAFGRPPYWD